MKHKIELDILNKIFEIKSILNENGITGTTNIMIFDNHISIRSDDEIDTFISFTDKKGEEK